MADPAPSPPRPRRTGAAIALITIGLLILVPSGLCSTLVFGYGVASDGVNALGDWLGLVLLFGGLPMIVGGVILVTALKLRRG